MEIKDLTPIFALLLAIGIIFGSYEALATGSLGFEWFVDMLWFAIGFPVLLIIALLVFAYATKGEAKILAKE